ncbi:MAG: hypothetical protein HUJ61_04985, partial [Bacilli bacterium]|nr:hypothetical protein [Bacilli bacterium]
MNTITNKKMTDQNLNHEEQNKNLELKIENMLDKLIEEENEDEEPPNDGQSLKFSEEMSNDEDKFPEEKDELFKNFFNHSQIEEHANEFNFEPNNFNYPPQNPNNINFIPNLQNNFNNNIFYNNNNNFNCPTSLNNGFVSTPQNNKLFFSNANSNHFINYNFNNTNSTSFSSNVNRN